MKKIIEWTVVWSCENLDNLSPIDWQGYKVLFDDNTTKFVDNLEDVAQYKVATEEEKKDFCRTYYKRIFQNDYVDIIKGRMKGQRKKVVSTFTYTVPNTYGKVTTNYFVFEDGTKTADTNTNYRIFNYEKMSVLISGRI